MQTPSQVAKQAHVTAQTIRNWSVDFGALLSPSARGEAGPRLYSDKDVEILCAIAALRKSGVPPGEIVARLEAAESPPVIDAVPSNEVQEVSKAGQDEALPPQMVLPMLLSRFEGIERRLDSQERRIESSNSQFVTGVIVGMGIAVVIVAIVLHMI